MKRIVYPQYRDRMDPVFHPLAMEEVFDDLVLVDHDEFVKEKAHRIVRFSILRTRLETFVGSRFLFLSGVPKFSFDSFFPPGPSCFELRTQWDKTGVKLFCRTKITDTLQCVCYLTPESAAYYGLPGDLRGERIFTA